AAGNWNIVTFCEEPRLAYDRVHLSDYFAGKTADDLSMVEPGYYEKHGIGIYIGEKAVRIDCDNKKVFSSTGREVSYDKLVLATGSYPFVPPVPGREQPHCHVYRTIEDLEGMLTSGRVSKTGVVVGGRLL